MGQLALEVGSFSVPEPSEEDVWAAQKLAGFKEVGDRQEPGIDLVLLWRKAGDIILLGARTDSGDVALTMVDAEDASESLEHPVQYFSHETSDRIFGRAA